MLARLRKAALPLALLGVSLYIIACEVDSADQFIRDVSVDFSGFYVNPNSDRIVARNTGAPIKTLDLVQNGDRLEGVDNNGSIWRGSLGEVQDGRSQFRLDGRTTTGTDATWSGTLSSDSTGGGGTNGGTTTSAQGTMSGTYVEPSFFSTLRAEATIRGDLGGGDDGGIDNGAVTVSSDRSSVPTNSTANLTASGGVSPYTWSLSGNGSLTTNGSRNAAYSRGTAAAGSVTITARDFAGQTGSVTLTLP